MVIYPAIDVLGGRCVRLSQGEYSDSVTYYEDPVDAARAFEDAGSEWLHLIDLDGAKAGRPVNFSIFERIRASTRLKIQTGGGVRSLESARTILGAGADRVIFGTAIAQDRALAAQVFAELGERAVAGVDMREGQVATEGWTQGGEDGLALAKEFQALGCRTFIMTDIATDGMLAGPNLDLMRHCVALLGDGVIASGGVSCEDDLTHLRAAGVQGVVVGKAIYEGRVDLKKLFGSAQPE